MNAIVTFEKKNFFGNASRTSCVLFLLLGKKNKKNKKTLNHTELDIFVTRVSSQNIVFFILKSKIWILYDICQLEVNHFIRIFKPQ